MKVSRSSLACAIAAAIGASFLAGCGSGGSSSPTGPPSQAADSLAALVQSVTNSNSSITARFVPAASLPTPSSTGVNPAVGSKSGIIRPESPIALFVYSTNPLDDVLVGAPGASGYYDLSFPVGSASSETFSPVPVTIILAAGAPAAFTLSFQTIRAGVVSKVTALYVATTTQEVINNPACGGGEVTATISNAAGSNVDTSPVTFDLVGLFASPQGNGDSLLEAQQCRNEQSMPSISRMVSLVIPQLAAGQTLTLGGTLGASLIYTGEGTWNASSGTLTITSHGPDGVLGFKVHANMVPAATPGGSSNPGTETFTLELAGTALDQTVATASG